MANSKYPFSLEPVDVPKIETAHRRIVTALPAPESIAILDTIQKFESTSVKEQLPVIWDSAKGHQIFDKWGNIWIDMTSTIFVTNSGHAHPRIVNAIKTQAEKLLHSYSYPTEIRALYLEKLIAITPPYLEKASLYSAGTEAIERAIKLARYHGARFNPRRKVIISWEGNYHGKTMGSQMVSGQNLDKDWIGYLDPNIVHLPFPFPWVLEKRAISGADLALEHLELLSSKFHICEDNIAAFIAESFQGWGALFFPKSYIKVLREWSDARDILIIFDEIQAGFGRCGTLFAFENYGVKPDLVCCGKGVSSSIPLSAVLGRAEIIDLDPAYTSTHGGHPIACAAGLANLEIIEGENLISESKRKEDIFRRHIEVWQERYPDKIGRFYGKGCLFGVFIIKGKEIDDPDDLDTKLCDTIVEKCMQNGVFLIRTGRGTLKFGPPLNIPDDALEEALDVVDFVIKGLV